MKRTTLAIVILSITGIYAACHKAQDTSLPNAFSVNGSLYGTPHAVAVAYSSSYQVLTLTNSQADSTSPKVVFAVDSLVTPWSYSLYDSTSPASYNNIIQAEVFYKDSSMKALTNLQDGQLTIHKTSATNFVVNYVLVYDSTSLTGHYSGTIQGLK